MALFEYFVQRSRTPFSCTQKAVYKPDTDKVKHTYLVQGKP